MDKKTTSLHRIMAWILAVALLFSAAFPHDSYLRVVAAEEDEPSISESSEPGTDESSNSLSSETTLNSSADGDNSEEGPSQDEPSPDEPINPPVAETVAINVQATNCAVVTPEGNAIEDGAEFEVGSTLSFVVIPLDGCGNAMVRLGTNTIFTTSSTTLVVTVKEGLTISAVSEDITAPSMTDPERKESGWVTSSAYTFTAEDNIGIASVQLVDEDGTATNAELVCDDTYQVTISANGTYTVQVKDAADNLTEKTIEETQVDPEVPVISKLERQTSGVVKSADYILEASDAISGIDKVILEEIGEEDKTLTANEDGSYSFTVDSGNAHTITVYDLAGNTATQAFTDEEIDVEGPTFSELSRNESGWQNNEVTYTIRVSDNLAGIDTVTFGKQGAESQVLTANEDGSYSATVSENGTYVVTSTDKLGTATEVNFTEEQIDKTAPSVEDPSRVTSGWSQKAEYAISAEDTQSGISSVIATCGNTTVTGQLLEDETYLLLLQENGEYTVTVTNGSGLTAQTTISETQVENADPVIGNVTRTPSNNNWTQESVYAFDAADEDSGIASVTVTIGTNDPVTLTATNGLYSFIAKENAGIRITVTDNAGNAAFHNIVESKVDTTAPEITAPVRQEESWLQGNAAYTFTVADDQSGVQTVTLQYESENPITLTPDESSVYSFKASSNGNYKITVTDAVGNMKSCTVTESLIDTTAPIIENFSRGEAGWALEANYSFTVSDSQSGLRSVTLSIADGEAEELAPDEAGVYHFQMTDNGSYSIAVTDNMGNADTKSGAEDHIDLAAPELSDISRQVSGWAASATYTFTASDTASGIASVTVTYGNGNSETLTSETDTYSFTMKANDIFTVTVVDAVGRTNTKNGEETQIDTSAPVISTPARNLAGWAASAVYSFTLTEEQSGIRTVSYKMANGENVMLTADEDGVYSFTVDTNSTYTITAKDAVGNESSIDVTEEYIDTTAPAIQELTRMEDSWATSVTYTFKVSDVQSGVAYVAVAIGSGEATELTAVDGVYSFTMGANDTFRITAIDSVDNDSSKNGKETQVDTTAPSIQNPNRASSVWSYSAEYTFTVTDAQSGVKTVTVQPENGAAVILQPDTDGKYSYIATENGTYIVTAVDIVGNTSSVTFTEQLVDYTAPTVTNVTREPIVWSQDALYSFHAEDLQSGIENVTISFGGESVTVEALGGGYYQFQAKANGSYSLAVTDVVGNKTTVALTENLIDLQTPVIHSVEPQQTWDDSENTITMKVTDESELVSVQVFDSNGKEYTVVSDGSDTFHTVVNKNGDYTVVAVDRAGNSITRGITVWRIDTESPSQPALVSTGKEQWVNTDVDLTAMATDTQSGVVAYWYSTTSSVFNASTWTKMEFASGTGSLHLTAEQNTDYYIVAQDEVGRISEVSKIHVYIDKTAPSSIKVTYLTGDKTGYNRIVDGKYIYNDSFSFLSTAKDTASGVVAYEYRVIGTNTSTSWVKAASGEVGISPVIANMPDDIYSVWVRVYDLAGNCSEEFTITNDSGDAIQHVLENTPASDAVKSPAPDVVLTTPGGSYSGVWTGEDVTLTVSGSSAISGIEYYQYTIDYADPAITDVSWTAVPVVDGKYQITASQDTNATYSFRAVTYAGNYSQVTTKTVKVQKTAPAAATLTAEAATGSHGWYTKTPGYTVNLPAQNQYFAPVHYEIRYTHDSGSQIAVTYDGTNAPEVISDGTWSFTIVAIDQVGHEATVAESTANFKVDTKVPDGLTVTMDGQDLLSVISATANWDQVNVIDQNSPTGFAIFRNTSGVVKVTVNGGTSGMDAVYYQIVAEDAQYSKDGNWTKLESGNLTLSPDSKCRLYFKAVDYAGNVTYFTGKSILLDATAPVASIQAEATNRSSHGLYSGNVTISVSVNEPSVGTANTYSGLKSITYRVLKDGSVTQSGQLYPGAGTTVTGEGGRITSWDGSFVIDAQKNNSNNIVVEVTAYDQAGNSYISTLHNGVVKIDVDTPTMVSSYDRNDVNAILGSDSIFTGSRTLTVTATERNFSASESFIKVTDTDTGKTVSYNWVNDGDTHTAVISVNADGHYTVSATIVDTAGNKTTQMGFVDGTAAASAFVIDNTEPVISVSYDNNSVSNEKFYSSARTVTFTVVERNFNPSNITAVIRFVDESGNVSILNPSSWTSNGSTHTAAVVCGQSGTYSVAVSGKDAVGISAQKATYSGETPYNFIVDTHMANPTVSGIENGKAYSGTVAPIISVTDTNLADLSVRIYRTRRNEISKDVTKELLGDGLNIEELANGKSLSLDVFPKEQEYDGIYTIVATGTDKAGNVSTTETTFSINRYGSVYVYDNNLVGIMDTSMQSLDKDLVIVEYNASGLKAGSARVYITADGVPIAEPIYTVTPTADGTEDVGASGWYEYKYTISAENFTEDGQYTVVISTEDAAGNIPENTDENSMIRFAVDTTAPELPSIIGMEEAIYKADSIDVTITASDNIGLASIVVYIDGEETARWEELSDFQFSDAFSIPSGMNHHVRIVVTDAAGNVLDTDSNDFAPGYIMQDSITVSTNFWLRFYANKPLFYGTICGCAVLLALAIFFLVRKQKNTNNFADPDKTTENRTKTKA